MTPLKGFVIVGECREHNERRKVRSFSLIAVGPEGVLGYEQFSMFDTTQDSIEKCAEKYPSATAFLNREFGDIYRSATWREENKK